MQYLFLDSNVFIHFIDFEQIDWKTIINSNDSIVIIIAPIVIDELDKHKYNKNQKISKRVKRLLPKIENLIENNVTSIYQIRYVDKRPIDSTFSENSLNKSESDDNLIATIIEFSKRVNEEDKVVFITNDVGPRLKARSLGIATFKPSDNYLLLNEPDEVEAENILLKKELNELKNHIPKVSLLFSNNTALNCFERIKQAYSKEMFVENKVKDEKQQNPYLKYTSPDNDLYKNPLFTVFNNSLFGLSKNQVEEYNEELDKYFDEFRIYADSLFEFFVLKKNSIELKFILKNDGTSPANDIDIELHFPNGFELFSEENLPKVKKKPSLPYKPKNQFDFERVSIVPLISSFTNPTSNINLEKFNSCYPKIKRTNSYNVNYHSKSLKHNQTLELEPIYAKFEDINNAKGFCVDYKLIISNVPNVISAQLNVKFQDKD